MEPLGFILALAIIIFSAKAAGYVSIRLHQPAVLGELLMGLILGPTVLNLFGFEIFSHGHVNESILYLAEAGVIFLMFLAGLEIDLAEMRQVGVSAGVVGVLGVIVPLLLGAGAALLFDFSLTSSIFIGLILTATSVSISAQTLMELGLLRTREGLTLLAAAVVDDVLVILLLSISVALTGAEGASIQGEILSVVGRMVLYLGVAVLVGVKLLPRLTRRISTLPVSQGLLSWVIVVTLIYAWAAEEVGGMAAITGAFLAGVLFSVTPLRERMEQGMHAIVYSLLVPIFFVSIGLKANARLLDSNDVVFTVVIVVVAVLSKILGCGLGARLTGSTNLGALRVGVGMVSRGEVGLIVASVGLSAALIPDQVFATMVIVVLVTTLLTPVMLRAAFQKKESA